MHKASQKWVLHNESHRKDKASQNFKQAGVVRVDWRWAALEDFRKKPSEREKGSSNELRRGKRSEKRTRETIKATRTHRFEEDFIIARPVLHYAMLNHRNGNLARRQSAGGVHDGRSRGSAGQQRRQPIEGRALIWPLQKRGKLPA